MLWSLVVLAPFSMLMSDLPRAWACPLAIAALALGVSEARRHGRLQPRALVIPVGRGQPTCDGQPMQALKFQWRGPLAFLDWRDPNGRTQRLAFWPDTLPTASRRELRLATMRIEPAREAASMAR
ncbi:MAG: hypothetical protein M3R16_06600 [Pseudomonadota bacterium]|nr:hypothetical protein [Pseudomonadota bacterium]